MLITWWENDEWVGKKDLALALIIAARFGVSARVLEVGLWRGGWTLHVVKNRGLLSATAIDPYPGLSAVRSTTLQRFASQGVALQLHESWASCEPSNQFDLVHIDGEHSEAAALLDLHEASRRLSDNGVIAVDDWLQPSFLGVNSAVHQFLSSNDFRIVLSTEYKAYLARSTAVADWQRYFVNQLKEIKGIPFEMTEPAGLGDYREARTVLGTPVIMSLGKPSGLLVSNRPVVASSWWRRSRWGRWIKNRFFFWRTP